MADSDPTIEEQNIVLILEPTLRKVEKLIMPAKCPMCRADVLEKTLVEFTEAE